MRKSTNNLTYDISSPVKVSPLVVPKKKQEMPSAYP